MTKYIRHKHKRHDPISNTPTTIYLNQFKTEVSIKQKNIGKLVFVDSDEEVPNTPTHIKCDTVQTSRQPRNSHELTLPKRKTLVNQFKPASSTLRPSLMRAASENQDDYDSMPNCQSSYVTKSTKINFLEKRQSVNVRSNNYFDEIVHQRDLVRDSYNNQQINNQTEAHLGRQPAQQNIVIHKNSQQKHSKIQTNQETISLPQLQITSLYFQVSDDEPEKEKQTSNNQTEPIKPTQSKENDTLEDIRYKAEAKQSANDLQADHLEPPKVDITDVQPNIQLDKRSLYLQSLLACNPSPEQALSAVFSPILPGTRQVFQVHVYSSLSEKEYYFWLNMSAEMRLMMKARKSTKLHKTEFEILTMHSQTQQFIETCRIVSNLDRSRFNILKADRLANKKRILGTLMTSVNINNAKLLVLYHPTVADNNTPVVFHENQTGLDLQQLYRQNKTGLIDYTITSRLPMSTKLNLMSHYELRASQKSMEFKNSKGDANLIIGKKGSKRYKIISGPGLAPVQIFSMTIVQIET